MIALSRATQSLARCSRSSLRVSSSRLSVFGARLFFGSVLAILGRPTIGIGLAGMSSQVKRKAHNTFQVDQHRWIEAAS